jgi:hypothetical protein
MQQRQLRLGDILDDYCPRERRVTNHVVVAMVENDVRQTRCTTCDADHEYKHAKVPRQRRKGDTPAALFTAVAATGSMRVAPERAPSTVNPPEETRVIEAMDVAEAPDAEGSAIVARAEAETHTALPAEEAEEAGSESSREEEQGPVHRTLIRASLPKTGGQAPPSRPIPEFTIRQPAGRQNRFRPRHERGGLPFRGNRPDGGMGGGPPRGGMRSGGRPPQGGLSSRPARRRGGPKRSK